MPRHARAVALLFALCCCRWWFHCRQLPVSRGNRGMSRHAMLFFASFTAVSSVILHAASSRRTAFRRRARQKYSIFQKYTAAPLSAPAVSGTGTPQVVPPSSYSPRVYCSPVGLRIRRQANGGQQRRHACLAPNRQNCRRRSPGRYVMALTDATSAAFCRNAFLPARGRVSVAFQWSPPSYAFCFCTMRSPW